VVIVDWFEDVEMVITYRQRLMEKDSTGFIERQMHLVCSPSARVLLALVYVDDTCVAISCEDGC